MLIKCAGQPCYWSPTSVAGDSPAGEESPPEVVCWGPGLSVGGGSV